MSINKTTKVVCPSCKKEFEIVFWDSINADLDPEAKAELLKGDLFNQACEHCGESGVVLYPVLYHDMSNKAMVYFVADINTVDSVREDIEAVRGKADGIDNDSMSDYKFRIVTDHNELREKALIFDNGLDDRVIEMIKILFSNAILKEKFDTEQMRIYFDVEENQYAFVLLRKNGEVSAWNLDKDFYDSIASEYGDIIEQNSKNEYFINNQWATSLFAEE